MGVTEANSSILPNDYHRKWGSPIRDGEMKWLIEDCLLRWLKKATWPRPKCELKWYLIPSLVSAFFLFPFSVLTNPFLVRYLVCCQS